MPRNIREKLSRTGAIHFEIFLFLVLGLELRAFTLNHSTGPIFVKGFQDRVFKIGPLS
jgi:hypothetical protein